MTEERRRRLTLAATVLGSSLAFVDATVVVVALPTIQHDLHFSLAGEQWVFLAYSLALAALYLPAGAVGDRRGRRETFMAGVVGFALASALAGAAPTGAVLIAARALQGVSGALLTPSALAIIVAVFPRDERGGAIGTWTAWRLVLAPATKNRTPPMKKTVSGIAWDSSNWVRVNPPGSASSGFAVPKPG